MERIKVGENTASKNDCIKQLEAKISAFNSVYEYLRSKSLRVRKKALYNDPFKEWKEAFYSLYTDDLVKRIPFEKALELFEFDVKLLHENISIFESIKYDFNPISFQYELPDFGIYIETPEQIERYKAVTNFIEATEDLKKHTDVFYGDIISATKRAVVPDFENQSIQPNLIFLLQ